jgi:hypothetical protein
MISEELFEDLVALEQNSFPKKCATCGAVYKNVEDFTARTVHINGNSGLKTAEGDEGETILELFRNCECGSTLLDFFADRRDMSAQGEKRRVAFDKVLKHLIDNGIEDELARTELKYYLRHKKSDLLDKLKVFKNRSKNDANQGE